MTTQPEFQVHIAGKFCPHHQPVIWIYQIEGAGLMARAKLVATFPEGEEKLVDNELQRYEYDMRGQDMPIRIIPGICGLGELREVLDREVKDHTRESDVWLADLMLGNLAGQVADTTGEFAGTYP